MPHLTTAAATAYAYVSRYIYTHSLTNRIRYVHSINGPATLSATRSRRRWAPRTEYAIRRLNHGHISHPPAPPPPGRDTEMRAGLAPGLDAGGCGGCGDLWGGRGSGDCDNDDDDDDPPEENGYPWKITTPETRARFQDHYRPT